jgi:hypothetical protein
LDDVRDYPFIAHFYPFMADSFNRLAHSRSLHRGLQLALASVLVLNRVKGLLKESWSVQKILGLTFIFRG